VHYDAGIDEPAEAMMRPEARSQSHDCGSMVSESPTMAVDAVGKTMPFDALFDASHAPSPPVDFLSVVWNYLPIPSPQSPFFAWWYKLTISRKMGGKINGIVLAAFLYISWYIHW